MGCDIRCSHCSKLLCKGCFEWLEIKCPRCGSLENIQNDGYGIEDNNLIKKSKEQKA